MITIQPQYLTLAGLLDCRLFRIPEYQRAYSWTRNQRNDLFGDIEKTFSKGQDAGHFMAAIVCLRRKKQKLGTDEYHVLEVVDGQQRLTTLIILLNAIKLRLDDTNKAEKKVLRELGELLVKEDGDELLLLQTNHDSSHYFARFLREGKAVPSKNAKTLADKEILEAIEDCSRFVDKWIKNNSLISLIDVLKNHLFLLLHEIDDEKAVYTVFEVLNSRGLDVSWLDRLKSILMGIAFELEGADQENIIIDLHNIWRDIYSVIGLHQGLSTEALRFAATLYNTNVPSRPLGEEDSVELLRSLSTTAKTIRKVAHWLLRVVEACDSIAANKRVNAVSRISQARLLAASIHLRDDLSEEERNELLSLWERVSFRIYGMLRNDARTRVGDYVRLAWNVINKKLSAKDIGMAIQEIGKNFPIIDAVNALRDTNCYDGWESELRYLMFRYEEYLATEQNQQFSSKQWDKIWIASPSESIEHIWAKSKAPDECKHRIGNLILLPPRVNSSLNDSNALDKIEAYRKSGLLIAGEVADTIINENDWNKRTIESREKKLLDWAATEWAD